MFQQDNQEDASWSRFCFIVTHTDFNAKGRKGKDKTQKFREQTAETAEKFATMVQEQFKDQDGLDCEPPRVYAISMKPIDPDSFADDSDEERVARKQLAVIETHFEEFK